MVTENPSQNRTIQDMPLVVASGLMIALYVISNVMATKLVAIGGFTIADSGTLTFPLVFMLGDILTEKWGYRVAGKIIWIAFACNVLTVLFTSLAVRLPAPDYQQPQADAFKLLFSQVPRITLASFIAFLAGEFSNAWSMALIRNWTHGKLLWLRTIGSSVLGFALDTSLFVVIAFGGISPLRDIISMIVLQFGVKMLIEICFSTPLDYGVLKLLDKWSSQDN